MFFEATYVPSPPLSVTSIEEDENHLLDDDVDVDIEPNSNKPVDHVIFVIHGIGQQTEKYGHFYEHIENLQETTRQILQNKVPDHNVRIELIPIEWHRHIHEQVDPIINKITLKSIPTIRLIENDYLADVLYYFSKDRGQKIIDNVTHLFNTSYHNFMEKHPSFNGKIIIMGYSLGGIITWDILSHQRDISNNQQEQQMYNKLDVKFSKLDFKPHYFFGLGSPIGAVLTFRGQDPTLYHPEFDIRFENVFHPFDPLGYRIEPLFNDYFTDKPAVLVERSIPIGPSFSFPSMPSFPLSAGFFSLFSWKQEDKAAKTIYNATTDAIEASEQVHNESDRKLQESTSISQDEEKASQGFMASFLQYFSRGGGTEKSKKVTEDGILTWDPLREQTREQLLALRDDLDRTLNEFPNHKINKRPSLKIRSKTYGVCTPDETVYSSSLEHNSDGSVVSSSRDSLHDNNKKERISLRKTLTEQGPKRQHLVEVLGIDGVKVDSFEATARENFNKYKNKEESKEQDGDIWLDLNKELHKPGPAITSPGETKAEIAQEATTAGETVTDGDEQEEVKKLPGEHRMDYVLQPDSFMSMIANEYLVGLRAHFSYWTNKDFIWHMLRRIEDLDQKDEEDNIMKLKANNTSSASIINIDNTNIQKKK